jgi:aspartyl-tRNA(Asn)/glutamyl-tRNA(Gln) amidotransferase subunit B
MQYEVIIGLEVHAQLLTKSKIFCSCSTKFGAGPNTQTCPVCLGMPGSLPVLNRNAVEYAIMMAVAINCSIAPASRFARKNYFYPDLPKGYQISQYEMPLAENGWIEINVNGQLKRVGVKRIHLEEDAGKSLHEKGRTLIDFNRCGIPLIEIVSEPDIRSTHEAVSYLKKLRTILRYLGICDGNMEQGSLRCDANISLRPKGTDAFGARAEVKNMNSFKGVQRALDYEIQRQRGVLESGGQVAQDTRLWDEAEGKTYTMRGKEESSDYRYFPEPDLLPVVTGPDWIGKIHQFLPELPDNKKGRFVSEYGLSGDEADILTSDRDLADYFESCQNEVQEPKIVAKWIINELRRELKTDERGIRECPLTPRNLARLIQFIKAGTISGRMAKEVFEEMYITGVDAEEIVKAKGKQITDDEEIGKSVQAVLEENTDQVARYRAGKEMLFDFFVGQVMKKTKGKANPQLVNKILEKELSG